MGLNWDIVLLQYLQKKKNINGKSETKKAKLGINVVTFRK